MYYNPQTKETLSQDNLKRFLNVSFPQNEEEVKGWYFLHNEAPSTALEQSVIPGEIVLKDGKYYQTYKIIDIPKAPEIPAIEDRISAIESGMLELARLIAKERM